VIGTKLRTDSSIVCGPSGSLDWLAAVSLRHVIQDSLRAGVDVVIDLSQVEFIDAVGISGVVGSVRRVRAVGGQAEICGASLEVRRRMQLAGVYRFLKRSSATDGDDAA
jgi:anti-sigma B factor antagonist